MKAANLEKEAEQVHKMRDDLESGDKSGAELAQDAKEAHELAEKLRADGKPELAKEVEELAKKLDGAAKAKLDADAKEADQEVTKDLKEASEEGHSVEQALKDANLEDDAKKVAEINAVVDDMANGGEVTVEKLNDTIKDTKDEIAKLKAEGHEDEAKALEKVLEKLEDAKAA